VPEAVPLVLLTGVFLAGGWLAASVASRIGHRMRRDAGSRATAPAARTSDRPYGRTRSVPS
jgi:hypothetical protein